MELFRKTVQCFKPSLTFAKGSILNMLLSAEYASASI